MEKASRESALDVEGGGTGLDNAPHPWAVQPSTHATAAKAQDMLPDNVLRLLKETEKDYIQAPVRDYPKGKGEEQVRMEN